jgi:hypothetical protein
MRTTAVMMLIVCLSSACTIGMSTSEFKLARAPQGIASKVLTATAQFTGELIEVREEAVVLLADEAGAGAPGVRQQRLRLIPFAAIKKAEFEQRGSDVQLADGKRPSPLLRERLRLLSRFPYGLSPAAERDLLKAYGQDGFAGVDR